MKERMNKTIDENKLVQLLYQGDVAAFEQLVERYKKKVYFLAFDILGDHHEAEDISQEVFIKVFRFIKKFRKDAKLSTWIYQITVNTSIDVVRKRSKRSHLLMDDQQLESFDNSLAENRGDRHGPEYKTELALFQRHIEKMLDKITPKERSAFVLRYYNELKVGEIAEVLSVSSGTIKSLLFRARKKLQQHLLVNQKKPGLEVTYGPM